MKKIYTILLMLLSSSAYSNIEVLQPKTFGGNFTNSSGNVIELAFIFNEPILTNEKVEFFIGDKKILSLTNETKNSLERFLGRFRFNKDDVLNVKTSNKNLNTSFKPNIITDIDLSKESPITPKILTRVVSDNLKKIFTNTKIGDCIFLVNGVSNTGNDMPKKFIVLVDSEKVIIDSSDRVSSSIVFSVGFDKTTTSCDVKVN